MSNFRPVCVTSGSMAVPRRRWSSRAISRIVTCSPDPTAPAPAISRSGRKLSELLEPFRARYFLTGEINTPVADVPLKLQQLKERYAALGGRISHLDGLSVEFDNWHFNVRPSNTEPLLRLNLEALSQKEMETRRDEVLELIRS